VNSIVSETLLKNMCDSNVDDVLYVLGNLQKRDIGARISPVQFLRDRELGIRGEKSGTVIREHILAGPLFVRQKAYPRLRDKCYEDDEYEKKHWRSRNDNVIKDDYYWAKKIVDKSRNYYTGIKIPAGGEKCVELLIINNMGIGFRNYNFAKLLLDRCSDRCCECERCIFAYEHEKKVIERYDFLAMWRDCSVCDRVTCKCSVEECDVI